MSPPKDTSGVNGIVKVPKWSFPQWDSNPAGVRSPVQANALTHSATVPLPKNCNVTSSGYTFLEENKIFVKKQKEIVAWPQSSLTGSGGIRQRILRINLINAQRAYLTCIHPIPHCLGSVQNISGNGVGQDFSHTAARRNAYLRWLVKNWSCSLVDVVVDVETWVDVVNIRQIWFMSDESFSQPSIVAMSDYWAMLCIYRLHE